MSSIYDAIQSANQFDSLAKEVSTKLNEINDQIKSAQYPIGSVSNPNYFDNIISKIHQCIHSLQLYVENSMNVFENTIQTKIREVNELALQYNTLLTNLDLARESTISKTPFKRLYAVPYITEPPYCTYALDSSFVPFSEESLFECPPNSVFSSE